MYVKIKIDQPRRIKELAITGQKANDIELILKKEYGEHAYKSSAIYKWIATTKFPEEALMNKDTPGRKPDEQLIVRIREELNIMPFASTRVIAENLNIWHSTAYRYLTLYLGLEYKKTRWVPHSLSNEQKLQRVNDSKELLSILERAKKQGWRTILTGDQSWFTFAYPNKGQWLEAIEDRPEEESGKIQVQKLMITVIWGVHGFYLVDFLERSRSYDSMYFISHILEPLHKKIDEILTPSIKRRLWLHLDNCRVHNSKKTSQKTEELGFTRTPHPHYSPDIAPSDFFLFGYMKEKLKGNKFRCRNELILEIHEILDRINYELRREVFQEWMKRCEAVIKNEGNYIHK